MEKLLYHKFIWKDTCADKNAVKLIKELGAVRFDIQKALKTVNIYLLLPSL